MHRHIYINVLNSVSLNIKKKTKNSTFDMNRIHIWDLFIYLCIIYATFLF